jgi:hypothetical protein
MFIHVSRYVADNEGNERASMCVFRLIYINMIMLHYMVLTFDLVLFLILVWLLILEDQSD